MFTVICHSYRLAHFESSDRFDAVVLTHTPTGLRQRLRQFLNMMFFALATLYTRHADLEVNGKLYPLALSGQRWYTFDQLQHFALQCLLLDRARLLILSQEHAVNIPPFRSHDEPLKNRARPTLARLSAANGL